MNICIVIGAFLPIPPLRGGAVEKMWHQLAMEFVKLGHSVTIISRQFLDLPLDEMVNAVRYIRVQGYETPRSGLILKVYDFLYARRACKMIPRDADIVVTNTFWAPILLQGKWGSKVYVDVARMPKGQMRLYGNVGRLRANSSPVALAIKSELPPQRHSLVKVIPNPLPFNLSVGAEKLQKEQSLLYAGRVHPEKGIHLILMAMKMIKNPMPLRIAGPWQFSEGGGGPEYWLKLKKLANGLPVHFLGPLYDMDALALEYKKAMIFIYPSLAEKGETFGLSPLEAMSYGCVPIVSDLACFRDFIHSGINGLVFDHRATNAEAELANCLQSGINNLENLESMAYEAIKVRDTHSPLLIAEAFLSDFKSITS